MSLALKPLTLSPSETSRSEGPNAAANDNVPRGCNQYLHLVGSKTEGTYDNLSRSSAFLHLTGGDLTYDGLGRRSHSLDRGILPHVETFHKHFGQMEIGDYTMTREGGIIGTGKPLSYTPVFRVILGQGVDERIAYYDVNGDDLKFYTTNHQGSTIAMTTEYGIRLPDSDGGKYVYDAYGNDVFKGTAQEVSMSGNPYRYTGRRLDQQTGLYYYRARYYDPKVGKFLQTDPIGYADQMNLYNYLYNDPLNGTDPTGEFGPLIYVAVCAVTPTCRAAVGATVGRAIGGVGAAVTGGDVKKSTLKGAIYGGVAAGTGNVGLATVAAGGIGFVDGVASSDKNASTGEKLKNGAKVGGFDAVTTYAGGSFGKSLGKNLIADEAGGGAAGVTVGVIMSSVANEAAKIPGVIDNAFNKINETMNEINDAFEEQINSRKIPSKEDGGG